MNNEKFFKNPKLPFVECRYSQSSVRHFKDHMHRSFSIGAVDKGAVQYRVGDREAVLKVGALAVINPESLHSCNSISGEQRSYYMLHFDTDWCLQVQKSLWNVESFVPAEKILLEAEDLYSRYCSVVNKIMDPTVHLLEKEQLLVGRDQIRQRLGKSIFVVEKISGLMLTLFGLLLPFT